jgi:hypothetical protein
MTRPRKIKAEIDNIEAQKFCLLMQAILGVQERLDKIINLLSENQSKGIKRRDT